MEVEIVVDVGDFAVEVVRECVAEFLGGVDGVLCGCQVGEFLDYFEELLCVVGRCADAGSDGCSLGFLQVSVVVAEGCFVSSPVGGVLRGAPYLLKSEAAVLGGSERWGVLAGLF